MFPLLTMTSTPITSVNVNSTPAASIMSHSTFNFGQKLSQFNRTYQVLLFRDLAISTLVKIEFLYIDIGCTNSHIQSVEGTEPSFIFTCNDSTSATSAPPALYQSNAPLSNYVGFSFQKNKNERIGGFLLKYSGMFLPISYIIKLCSHCTILNKFC